MDVKGGSRASVNAAHAQEGVVLEIDANRVALVRMSMGNQVRVRIDTLRGKSAPPRPGERWIFDQAYGLGWQFAVPLNWTADPDWIAPEMMNAWTSTGTPYPPVGYRRTVEGETVLCGQISGGTAGSTAFILPPGYRPVGTVVHVVAAGATSAQLTITADGHVAPGSSGPTFLDGVRFFMAEA